MTPLAAHPEPPPKDEPEDEPAQSPYGPDHAGRPCSSARPRPGRDALPAWWSAATTVRDTLLGLAGTPGPLPSVVAARLAAGMEPARLLRADSPDPRLVAARLDELGVRFMVAGEPGWPLEEAPADPPCAWLFVDGPDPPGPALSAAIVGGRKASALRRATARSLAAGLVASGICVVSGGAIGVDAAAHAGALDGGGHTVVVLGCGLDVPYPRRNVELFRRVREAGGTLLAEHPPGAKPLAANFVPRNRLIAALAGAVVVVEAALGSGSLATARAAGSRGHGQVLAVPGAPWDRGAAGCNDLIRDGATLVRGLDDVLEALSATAAGASRHAGGGPAAVSSPRASGDRADGASRRAGGGGAAGEVAGSVPRRPWPAGASREAWRALEALTDERLMGLARLSAVCGLGATQVAAALLELELAGFVRRSAAGAEAIALPLPPVTRGPPAGGRTRLPDREGA
jgi:DNA processing protein